jgi:hypothetical protein
MEVPPAIRRVCARTLAPRQAAYMKEVILKGGTAIAHPGCKGKTIIVKPQTIKTH